jgi:recombinational DNA repair protein RecT
MYRKTVVRRGAKYLPLSTEDWSRALEMDHAEFEPGPAVARKAPPSLREAIGMAAPERDAGETEREPGADDGSAE